MYPPRILYTEMASTLEEDVYQPQLILLSVFGSTNKVSKQGLLENTLTPLLQEWGRPPDRVLLPSEGNSSIYIQDWADSLRIKTQVFYADWAKYGRMAQILRDDRMYKECTHALVFLSQKSVKLEKFAEKMAKKGKMVFTSSCNQTLTQLELSHSPPSGTSKASGRARKSDKGIAQMWQKYRTKAEC